MSELVDIKLREQFCKAAVELWVRNERDINRLIGKSPKTEIDLTFKAKVDLSEPSTPRLKIALSFSEPFNDHCLIELEDPDQLDLPMDEEPRKITSSVLEDSKEITVKFPSSPGNEPSDSNDGEPDGTLDGGPDTLERLLNPSRHLDTPEAGQEPGATTSQAETGVKSRPLAVEAAKRRGRPPGAKNKPKDLVPVDAGSEPPTD